MKLLMAGIAGQFIRVYQQTSRDTKEAYPCPFAKEKVNATFESLIDLVNCWFSLDLYSELRPRHA
jgi:hypothetical protein